MPASTMTKCGDGSSDNVARPGDLGAIVSEISAAILIGGRARRLDGRVKPLLPVGGRPILTDRSTRCATPACSISSLVGRWTVDERPPAPVVADALDARRRARRALYGAARRARRRGAGRSRATCRSSRRRCCTRLSTVDPDADAVVPRTEDGLHPLCGWYRREVALAVESASGSRRARGARRARGTARAGAGICGDGRARSGWHDADERQHPRRLRARLPGARAARA